MRRNIILATDSYKASHFLQYPPRTEYLSSYIESRGGAYSHALFFGLQAFLKDYLATPVTLADIEEARDLFAAHGEPFDLAGWTTIVRDHGGLLPLRIEAVAEGSIVPVGNVLVQIVNTDPRLPWLTSYIETALLRAVWYPSTVATRSRLIKQLCLNALAASSDDPAAKISFMLHDFGARGVSSSESAGLGGAAHLVNFLGTDNIEALLLARRYYDERMAGFSIPAAEHSTITSWGRRGEVAAYANMLNQFGGSGKLVAVVSDSYDLFNAVDNIWGHELKSQVLAMGGTLVVRPDSGDPKVVPIQAIEKLAAAFGTTTNRKGFKVLHPSVRVIQGDGVNEVSIKAILDGLIARGYSADNIVFGMGGELLQTMNRDTQRWAMKASAVKVTGDPDAGPDGWREVFKQPATDLGKKSKPGRLALIRDGHGVVRTDRATALKPGDTNLLEDVWLDGRLLRQQTLADIRTRADAGTTLHRADAKS
jgi:nicotinamide phosphoribosyltransferase